MGFERGRSKTGGRPKGGPNKRTKAVKEALELAFEGIGGVPALIKWAQRNPDDFYRLWSKLLPKDFYLSGKNGGPIQTASKVYRPSDDEIERAASMLMARLKLAPGNGNGDGNGHGKASDDAS